MEKHIIISSLHNLAAILHDGYLYRFIINDPTYQLGNVYLGTIERVFPAMKALFVTIQINRKYKNGFIHINDLLSSRNCKNTTFTIIVMFKQKLYVQIIKEAFFGKNPRLTTSINIPGRYIVFSPSNQIICISRKISNPLEKEHLKSLALLLRPLFLGGIFFKSVASKVNEDIVIQEWKNLKARWIVILKLINSNTKISALLLYKDLDLIKKIIRDIYTNKIRAIFIDSHRSKYKIYSYLEYWSDLILNPSIRIYYLSNLFLNSYRFYFLIAQALQCRVQTIPTGYIFIENFEALTFIDVNSGILEKYRYPSDLTLSLNCLAAKEIAYQINIRNISGIIIIDFINMISKREESELIKYLYRLFKNDNNFPQIVQFSKLGLVEITRKRIGKNLLELLNSYQPFFLLPRQLSFQNQHFKHTLESSNNLFAFYLLSKIQLNCTYNYSSHLRVISKSNLFFNNKHIQYNKTKFFVNTILQYCQLEIA
uniref:ribonuclease E n=1 Tax=Goniotrichopsis reniformis TaxID=468933 RepID=UPI001FCE1DAE|nr:ribonuclease E [Goniotrichopsis reniformis]UNJ14876.1 ribonuclease E [Goniotrichopsis reniformis]